LESPLQKVKTIYQFGASPKKCQQNVLKMQKHLFGLAEYRIPRSGCSYTLLRALCPRAGYSTVTHLQGFLRLLCESFE